MILTELIGVLPGALAEHIPALIPGKFSNLEIRNIPFLGSQNYRFDEDPHRARDPTDTVWTVNVFQVETHL